jgi:hypothetical protein
MVSLKKRFKKYERHFLLAIVIILLASFSVTGAFSCQGQGPNSSYNLGGTFNVAPGEGEEMTDQEFDRAFAKYNNFQYSIRMPSRDFRIFLEGVQTLEPFRAAWAHHLLLAAARAAGYDAGDHQVRGAVEDMVGFALLYRARMQFSEVNYKQYLRQNFSRGSQTEFEEGVREIVLKDQFLYPLITSSRYQVPYQQAYDDWRTERERVDLEYVALPAAPFEDAVRKDELTRVAIGKQVELLSRVTNAAATLRRVRAKIDSHKTAKGTWPTELSELGTAAQPFVVRDDPWDNALQYEVEGDEIDLRSAGPDGSFGTADDVTTATQEQLDTHGGLYELAEKLGQRRTATGTWPKTLQELKSAAGGDRLPGLVRNIQDGWKRDFVYVLGEGDAAPTLTSNGPDGEAGTDDDIGITLDADKVEVVPSAALMAFVDADLKDSWDRPLVLRMSRAQPPTWEILSAGADGEQGTDDDLKTGNAQELKLFFNSVRNDYALPARSRFETLFVHLPLMTDEALKRLWDKYPQHRPTDEDEVYEWWRSYKGADFFYRAEDPSDPEKGHGAELAARVAPEARVTLVPSKDIFPDPLTGAGDKPGDAPKKDDPKKGAAKGDDAEKDDAEKDDPADAADRKTFRDKGWREIVIREQFMESLLNDILTRVRDNRVKGRAAETKLAAWTKEHEAYLAALAAWEQANADKPEAERTPKPAERKSEKPVVPAAITFESVLASELAELVDSGDAKTPPAIQYWQTPELMSREEWEKNENFGEGLQFELSRLKEDGEYNGIPAQLNRRLTKVLVRRLEFKDRELQPYEDVQDKVFDQFIQRRLMDRAAAKLETLRTDAQKAVDALPGEADEAAKQAAWDGVYEAWSKDAGAAAIVERTGLFIGNVPPPEIEIDDNMDAALKAESARRNFVWRAGYATVRPSASTGDTVTATPGAFGRSILRDPVVEESGSGAAYMIRVVERAYPSKAEFSPSRYVRQLSKFVLGDRRSLGQQDRLNKRNGLLFQSLARYFDDIDWLRATFDLQTNAEFESVAKNNR